MTEIEQLDAAMRDDLAMASLKAGAAWIKAMSLWGRAAPETKAVEDAWQAISRVADAYPTEAAVRLRDRADG